MLAGEAFERAEPHLSSGISRLLLSRWDQAQEDRERLRDHRYAIERMLRPRRTRHACSELDIHLATVDGDGWDCGYRNLQMLLSALVKGLVQTTHNATYSASGQGPPATPWRTGQVPNVLAIQEALEIAWSCGFDEMDRSHFYEPLRGSRQWIGTSDAAALLRYWGVDVRLVDSDPQFQSERESRHQSLMRWALQYYVRRCARAGGCIVCRQSGRSTARASDGDVSNARAVHAGSKRNDWIPPLFFQYAGHSVTVIGVEIDLRRNESCLLLIDPSQGVSCGRPRIRAWTLQDLQAVQYQVLYIHECVFLDERTPMKQRQKLSSLRLV